LEWVDLDQCLTLSGAAPVLEQFCLVKFGPGEHESQLPAAERALDRLEGVDPDLRGAVGVAGVEVGGSVSGS
jgi:hypothetical protein